MSKLPAEAFSFYLSLGPGRSYQTVADHFGVSKRAVVDRAVKEDWQRRAAEVDQKAQRVSEDRAVESLADMRERHLKMLRAVQARALEAIKAAPLVTTMEGVKALLASLKDERVLRGEPGERTALAVEDVIKREYEHWMDPADTEGETDGLDDLDDEGESAAVQ